MKSMLLFVFAAAIALAVFADETVQGVGVSELTVWRKDSGEPFGTTATIAAGGKDSDVHKAEIRVKLSHVPAKHTAITLPASLTGAAAYHGKDVASVLTCGTSSITGNTSGTIKSHAVAG